MNENTFILARPSEQLKVGLVLRDCAQAAEQLFRITHVFPKTLFVMPVASPALARYAVRPKDWDLDKTIARIDQGELQLGRLRLPQEFLSAIPSQSPEDPVNVAYAAIEPLIKRFDVEQNLSRARFTALINSRATELDFSVVSLRRLLLRFYYFGRIKAALLPLKPGPDIGSQRPSNHGDDDSHSTNEKKFKRRGRQPIEAKTLGPNTFLVDEVDVADMVACFEEAAKSGHATYVEAHKEYLRGQFSRRHPQKYTEYLEKKCPLPVTLRQFRGIVKERIALSRDIVKNIPTLNKRARKGFLGALGPGEIYEIDATGGRIFLVDSKPPYSILKTPIIYLIIDRWSRFIVSVYITLRPASWEEIRYALLIAFTSRKQRFSTLGVNVSDERWPQGKVCARLVTDRGSEMISEAMLESAVDGLQIEVETLPPLCPDGKGIIERVIRELKRKMHQRGLKGSFEKRPIDPVSKRQFNKAKTAAAHTLREIYWTLLDIVDSYNNSPHSHLEKNGTLRQARVRPTPRDAYVWGLENITGIESPPLSDADYQRLLLGKDKATLANGQLTYRGRKYRPANAAADRQARLSNSRRRAIDIRVDRSYPVEIFAPNGSDDWPMWEADSAAMKELGAITLEEEDALSETHKLLIAETRNDAFIDEQNKRSQPTKRVHRRSYVSTELSPAEAKNRSEAQSIEVKNALLGRTKQASNAQIGSAALTQSTSPVLGWKEIEEQERLATVRRKSKKRHE